MVRIQLRRDTAANWTSSNPVLRAGEVGIETDTLKFKVGNGTSTWTQITAYANVTPTSLTSSLASYIESGDLGQPSGPAQLTAGGDLLVPENEIIMWSADTNTYTTTLAATQPTANRTITLKDGTGTLAFTSDVPSSTDSLSEGTTNKYFTDERAQDAAATALANGSHTNITVTYNDSSNAISLAAAPGYVDEQAVDAVAAALAAGTHTNISVSYNDAGNSISLTGAQTYNDEMARDAIGAALTAGDGVSVTTNDGADTITIANTGVTSIAGTSNQITSSGSTGSLTLSLPNSLITPGDLSVTGSVEVDGNLTVHGTTFTVNSQTLEVQDNLIYLNAPKEATITGASGNGTNVTYTASNDFIDGEYVSVVGITPSGFNIAGTVVQRNANSFKIASSFQDTYVSGGTAYSRVASNPDIGFAGGYNDGSYAHTGLFRDASDNGTYKFFKGYTPEPESDIYIDTTHASFSLAPLAASTVTATTFTGNLTGNVTGDVSGNAGTVTNGVYTTGTYSNPSWITGLGWSKISSTPTTLSGYGITDALSSSTAASTYQTIVSGVSNTEIGYLDGVTSAIQTQINGKLSTSGGTVTGNTTFDGTTNFTGGDGIIVSQGAIFLNYPISLGSGIATDYTNQGSSQGTSGQVLTSNGSYQAPSWTTLDALPSQSGNTGKYLTTDGTNASWGTLVVPISTGTVTVNQNTAQDVDSTALSAFTSIEYMISIKQGSKVRTSKVIMQTDGTSVDMTEFAITETGGTISGVVVSATTASSNGKLQVTVTNALSTNATVKFSKVAL